MPKDGEGQLVPGPGKLARRSAALVRRGLDDLEPLTWNRPRVLVISDEGNGDFLGQVCREDGCEATALNPVPDGRWELTKTLEEAVGFQPDVTILNTNLLIRAKGSPLCNFVLRLFERLPNSRFVLMLLYFIDGGWMLEKIDTDKYGETLGEIQAAGYEFDILWMPFEKEELLKKIRAK